MRKASRRPRPASSPGALDHIWWPRQMTYLCLAGVPPTALGTSPGEAEMKQVPSVCLFRTLAISGRPRELTRGSTGELRLGRRALPAEAQAKHPPAVSWEHTRPADSFHCTGVVGLGTWQRALGDITWDDHGVPHTTLKVWTAEGRLKDSSTSLVPKESPPDQVRIPLRPGQDGSPSPQPCGRTPPSLQPQGSPKQRPGPFTDGPPPTSARPSGFPISWGSVGGFLPVSSQTLQPSSPKGRGKESF